MSGKEVTVRKEHPVPSTDPEALILAAINKNVDVGTMERLLAMRRELKEEHAKEAYFRALSAFQAECPAIHKDKQVYDKNNKPRYRYAPLDDIVKQVSSLLDKHGFSYTIETEQQKGEVTAICRSHHVDGHSSSTKFAIPVDPDAYMNAAQKVASALTYAKRYAFCNAFGIMTSDTDDDAIITKHEEEDEEPKRAVPAVATELTPEQLKEKENKSMYIEIKKMKDGSFISLEQIQKAIKSYGDDSDWASITDEQKYTVYEYLKNFAEIKGYKSVAQPE